MDLRQAVEDLREPETRRAAWKALWDAGDAAIPAAGEGLGHQARSVRRWCAAFLDHHIDEPARHKLVGALGDKNRKVRAAAVHALGCDRCKPEEACGTAVDVVGHAIAVLRDDPSGRVRRHAVGALSGKPAQQRIIDALAGALRDDSSERVRAAAAWVLGKYDSDSGALRDAARLDPHPKVRAMAGWALGSHAD
jgi:HEAT repeat protein